MNSIIVDPEDAWLLDEYSWRIDQDGYAITVLSRLLLPTRKHVFLHHCIVGQPIWQGLEVDHRNRNKLDNRRQNLRYVTPSQNQINKDYALGQTGEKYVTISGSGKYMVQFKRNKVMHYVGSYTTVEEAIAARDAWLQHEVGVNENDTRCSGLPEYGVRV